VSLLISRRWKASDYYGRDLFASAVVWNFEIFPPFKKLGDNIYREGIAMTGECTATFEEKAAPTPNHLVIPEMWSAR
jgi:hypothetical protein